MEIHVAALERFAAEMPVDILAHPTLLPVPLRALPIESLWTEARETRAVAALRGGGIAFEISNRYRPHERFVQRAHAAGVRLSLGSDGHTRRRASGTSCGRSPSREPSVCAMRISMIPSAMAPGLARTRSVARAGRRDGWLKQPDA